MAVTPDNRARRTRRHKELDRLEGQIVSCRTCPRLVAWREEVAQTKRAAYADEDYWGRPLPGFGDPDARLVLVGLAPAAHGGNRTGRMFTGDRSGDFLFASLHRAGYASQPESHRRGDGLELTDVFVTGAVRCAPPDNRPTPDERDACAPFLAAEIALLTEARVVLALGSFAFDAVLRSQSISGDRTGRAKPKFGHGLEWDLPASVDGISRTLLCSYHPSQRNVFTGRLDADGLDAIFARARELCG